MEKGRVGHPDRLHVRPRPAQQTWEGHREYWHGILCEKESRAFLIDFNRKVKYVDENTEKVHAIGNEKANIL